MTRPLPGTLGIDFGTSNSAMAWAAPGGTARLIALEGQATAMPTAVFYNSEDHSTHFGRDAVTQYLEGTEGRLMRSLKSLLGSPLLLETTVVNNRQISFQEIIATFLATLRERATQALGAAPARVVMAGLCILWTTTRSVMRWPSSLYCRRRRRWDSPKCLSSWSRSPRRWTTSAA